MLEPSTKPPIMIAYCVALYHMPLYCMTPPELAELWKQDLLKLGYVCSFKTPFGTLVLLSQKMKDGSHRMYIVY